MFKFHGTYSELSKYLRATFTKKTRAKLELWVDAQSKTFQARGTLKEVRSVLGLVYRDKHIRSMPLEVQILQPFAAVRQLDTNNIPADVTLAEVHNLCKRGLIIASIKAYRVLTGVGLREAKDYIDAYRDENGIFRPGGPMDND